ncbi:hypothetical protein MKW92_008967, partial [Papaver armeniacum]
MHCSTITSALRLCSGLRKNNGIAPPPPCYILRSTRQHRRYNNISLSDAAADDDFYTFEKFTEEAIDVVTRAKDEAKRSGYDLFGAEHVLLAIISEGTSIAADILTNYMHIYGVEDARKIVKTFTKQGSRFDANRVFKLSIDSARKLCHDHVDIEHILLALIPEDESNGTIVLDILKKFGVDPTSARKKVLQRMDREKMSKLEIYCTNLTKLAKSEIQAGPVTKHTQEVAEQVIKTLCTPPSKNPCLIGVPELRMQKS